MTPIFIDTSAFIALLRQKDVDHNKAGEKLKIIIEKNLLPVTTDYILDETYTGLLKRENYRLAMEFDRQINTADWKVKHINKRRFTQAQLVFRKFNKDKLWSFTDCTSYVVIKELKLAKVFAFDNHFIQMGFKLL